MSEKQKMCTVVDLSISILACMFAAFMFTGTHNQFPPLTMVTSKLERLGGTKLRSRSFRGFVREFTLQNNDRELELPQ